MIELELSLIIPAYNEERRLPPTLLEIVDYLDSSAWKEQYEILVIDDGSSDGTEKAVKRFQRLHEQVHYLSFQKNSGKGAAVQLGMLNAKGHLCLFCDADGATPIAELEKLVRAIEQGAHVAIGSRAKPSSDVSLETVWYRKYIGRTFNTLVSLLVLRGFHDTQCGFKLFTHKAAQFLFSLQRCHGFSFDVEILYLAQKANLNIAEIPVNWVNIPGSKVNLLRDSARMFWDMLHFRYVHRGVAAEDFERFSE